MTKSYRGFRAEFSWALGHFFPMEISYPACICSVLENFRPATSDRRTDTDDPDREQQEASTGYATVPYYYHSAAVLTSHVVEQNMLTVMSWNKACPHSLAMSWSKACPTKSGTPNTAIFSRQA